MAGERFTAWLSEGERGALRRLARRHGCSENYLVRVALRAMLFGASVPPYLQDGPDNDGNDSNGGNDKDETIRTAR